MNEKNKFLILFLIKLVSNSLRSSIPVTDLGHRTPVPDSKDGSCKVGPRYTYQGVGQSSDIGTIDLDVGDRHQTSPEEGEIGRQGSEQLYWATKGLVPELHSYQLKTSYMRKT